MMQKFTLEAEDDRFEEILQEAIGKSCAKSEFSIKMLVILSFLGGRLCRFGYLACLRVTQRIPAEWNGLAAL